MQRGLTPAAAAAKVKHIVGFEMVVDRMEGVEKMSQNRTEDDRAGVVAALDGSHRAADRSVAEHMRRLESGS